jgi:hypothetical protein
LIFNFPLADHSNIRNYVIGCKAACDVVYSVTSGSAARAIAEATNVLAKPQNEPLENCPKLFSEEKCIDALGNGIVKYFPKAFPKRGGGIWFKCAHGRLLDLKPLVIGISCMANSSIIGY